MPSRTTSPNLLVRLPTKLAGRAAVEAVSALALLRAGAFGLEPPRRLLRVLLDFQRHGPAGAALSFA